MSPITPPASSGTASVAQRLSASESQ